ncbi:MAG: Ig-like domain-containing protein [Candidatus Gracilibacteria bacterium]
MKTFTQKIKRLTASILLVGLFMQSIPESVFEMLPRAMAVCANPGGTSTSFVRNICGEWYISSPSAGIVQWEINEGIINRDWRSTKQGYVVVYSSNTSDKLSVGRVVSHDVTTSSTTTSNYLYESVQLTGLKSNTTYTYSIYTVDRLIGPSEQVTCAPGSTAAFYCNPPPGTNGYSTSLIGSGGFTTPAVTPMVTITSPANGQTVSGIVTMTSSVTNQSQVGLVQYFYNGGAGGGNNNWTSGYNESWDTTVLPNGVTSYTLSAKAWDLNGSVIAASSANSVTVSVNNQYASVSQQPANTTVNEGQRATFTAAASGTGPYFYQWTRNGVDIQGANTSSYQTPPTTPADSGTYYHVKIWNNVGTLGGVAPKIVTSTQPAYLTVNPNVVAPTILVQPANISVTTGQPAAFSVSATGTNLSYQWKKGGATINGAVSSTYTIPSTVIADDGILYSVTVSNTLGSVTSANALLTVSNPPAPSSANNLLWNSDFEQWLGNYLPQWSSAYPTTYTMWAGGQPANYMYRYGETAAERAILQARPGNSGSYGVRLPDLLNKYTETVLGNVKNLQRGNVYKASVWARNNSDTPTSFYLGFGFNPHPVPAGDPAHEDFGTRVTLSKADGWKLVEVEGTLTKADDPRSTVGQIAVSVGNEGAWSDEIVVDDLSLEVISGKVEFGTGKTWGGYGTPRTINIAPTITSIGLGAGTSGKKVVNTGSQYLSNDNKPTIQFSTQKAGTNSIQLFDGTTLVKTFAAPGSSGTLGGYTALSDGTHALTLKVVNVLGEVLATSNTITVQIDTKAPVYSAQGIGSVAAGKLFKTYNAKLYTNDPKPQLQFALTEETNGSGLNTSKVMVKEPGGTAHTTLTSFTPVNNLSLGSNEFELTGEDIAGNASKAYITIEYDPTSPVVSMISPAALATVGGPAVTISALATDNNAGVAGVQFLVDGANIGVPDTVSPYQMVWNASTATKGTHTVSAIATDGLGLTTTSSSVIFTVDNSLPTISAQPANATVIVGESATFSISATSPTAATYQWKRNGVDIPGATAAGYTIPVTTLADGAYTYTCTVINSVGSVVSDGVTLTVNNQPTITVMGFAANTAGKTVNEIGGQWYSNDTNLKMQYGTTNFSAYSIRAFVGGVAGSTFSNPGANGFLASLGLTTQGTYTLSAALFKPSTGATVATSNALSVILDTTAPTIDLFTLNSTLTSQIGIEEPAKELPLINGKPTTSSSSVTVKSTFTDTGGSGEYANGSSYIINSGTPVSFLGSTVTVPLQSGLNNLSITHMDRAGNPVVKTAQIVVDNTAPVLTWALNGTAGAPTAAWRNTPVTTVLTCTDSNPGCRVQATYVLASSPDPVCTATSSYTATSVSNTLTLPVFDKPTKICARAVDASGLSSANVGQVYTINIDTAAPVINTVSINNGATSTATRDVIVKITTPDIDIASCKIGNTAASLTPVATSCNENLTWTLLSGDGPKTIYAQLCDAAGNCSAVKAAGIILDTSDPNTPLFTDTMTVSVTDLPNPNNKLTFQLPKVLDAATAGDGTIAIDHIEFQLLEGSVALNVNGKFFGSSQITLDPADNKKIIIKPDASGKWPTTLVIFDIAKKHADGTTFVYGAKATAIDILGNVNTAQTLTNIAFDVTPPSFSGNILFPGLPTKSLDGKDWVISKTQSMPVSFTIGSSSGTSDSTVAFRAYTGDPRPLSYVTPAEMLLAKDYSSTGPVSDILTVSGSYEGKITFVLIDAAGNESVPQTINIWHDASAPGKISTASTAVSQVLPAGLTASNDLTLSLAVSDNTGISNRVLVKYASGKEATLVLDNQLFKNENRTVTGNWRLDSTQLPGFPEGSSTTLSLTFADLVGNEFTVASIPTRIDTKSPVVSNVQYTFNNNKQNLTLSFTVNDISPVRITLDGTEALKETTIPTANSRTITLNNISLTGKTSPFVFAVSDMINPGLSDISIADGFNLTKGSPDVNGLVPLVYTLSPANAAARVKLEVTSPTGLPMPYTVLPQTITGTTGTLTLTQPPKGTYTVKATVTVNNTDVVYNNTITVTEDLIYPSLVEGTLGLSAADSSKTIVQDAQTQEYYTNAPILKYHFAFNTYNEQSFPLKVMVNGTESAMFTSIPAGPQTLSITLPDSNGRIAYNIAVVDATGNTVSKAYLIVKDTVLPSNSTSGKSMIGIYEGTNGVFAALPEILLKKSSNGQYITNKSLAALTINAQDEWGYAPVVTIKNGSMAVVSSLPMTQVPNQSKQYEFQKTNITLTQNHLNILTVYIKDFAGNTYTETFTILQDPNADSAALINQNPLIKEISIPWQNDPTVTQVQASITGDNGINYSATLPKTSTVTWEDIIKAATNNTQNKLPLGTYTLIIEPVTTNTSIQPSKIVETIVIDPYYFDAAGDLNGDGFGGGLTDHKLFIMAQIAGIYIHALSANASDSEKQIAADMEARRVKIQGIILDNLRTKLDEFIKR